MTLGDIVLRDASQMLKATYPMIPLIGNVQHKQIQGHKAEWWLPGPWAKGERG